MADTVIQALRDYLLACPLLGDSKINIDYLPERGVEYSIDTVPATEVVRTYVDGTTLRQYVFTVRSVQDYGSDVLQNLSNSGVYEQLAEWLERQAAQGNLPDLPAGKTAMRIEAQSTGYLFTTAPDAGRYQIQCRLIYRQKG